MNHEGTILEYHVLVPLNFLLLKIEKVPTPVLTLQCISFNFIGPMLGGKGAVI